MLQTAPGMPCSAGFSLKADAAADIDWVGVGGRDEVRSYQVETPTVRTTADACSMATERTGGITMPTLSLLNDASAAPES